MRAAPSHPVTHALSLHAARQRAASLRSSHPATSPLPHTRRLTRRSHTRDWQRSFTANVVRLTRTSAAATYGVLRLSLACYCAYTPGEGVLESIPRVFSIALTDSRTTLRPLPRSLTLPLRHTPLSVMSSPRSSPPPAAGTKRSASPAQSAAAAPAATFYSAGPQASPNAKRAKLEEGKAEQGKETDKGNSDGEKGEEATTAPSESSLAPPPRRPLETADSFDDLDGEAEALIAAAEAAENLDARPAAATAKNGAASTGSNSSSTATKPAAGPTTTASSSSSTTTSTNDPFALERSTMDPLWFSRLEPEMHKPTFRSLKNFLEAEKKQRQTVYPPEKLIHSWSRLTPLDRVKVVVVGQDPYHGPGQACGELGIVGEGKKGRR